MNIIGQENMIFHKQKEKGYMCVHEARIKGRQENRKTWRQEGRNTGRHADRETGIQEDMQTMQKM